MTDQARDRFEHPLIDRYAGKKMVQLFSPRVRYGTWRELWLALARAEHELGLPISREQLEELEAHRDEFDWNRLAELEAELRHDVMAHVRYWGEVAPGAGPILHLGATSCYVTDNADLILYRRALGLIEERLCSAISALVRGTFGFVSFIVCPLTATSMITGRRAKSELGIGSFPERGSK